VSCSPRSEEHFDTDDHEHGKHGYCTCHGRVIFIPKIGKTGVREGDEGRGEQVDEGGSDQDARAEVAGEEEEAVRDGQFREAAGDDGEGACCNNFLVRAFHLGVFGFYRVCLEPE
jgi:hypothetical protein